VTAGAFTVTAGDVAAATGGRLTAGSPDRAIDGFSIDSRTVAAGDLFFAIRGGRFDGHAFVGTAFERGACGAVVSEPAAVELAERIVVMVGDTTRALQDLARDVRRRSGSRVVAITGSAGKTTTKEVTAEFLAARYRVFRNRGNLNNHIGLPLSLLELRARPEVAVVELGMNHAGEIRTLVGISEPDVRVWTLVAEVHSEFFASIDAIADAKAEILERASAGTMLVANANDARIMARARLFEGRLRTFGIETGADVAAWQVRDLGLDGMQADVSTPAGDFPLETPLVGRGNLANVLAATAVALEFGIPIAAIAERTARLRPAKHRGEILRTTHGITIVDDVYNSNPAAVEQALDVFRRTPEERRVAILGEMLELGGRSIPLHEETGRAAAAARLRRLVTVGGEAARALGRAAADAGLGSAAIEHFTTSEEAADAAPRLVQPGDVVLVKGSRGVRMERIVQRLAELA
jgi:UDP-N-acetylmuramoyl-tripeptide--D-alanyl-D-alanine ligase